MGQGTGGVTAGPIPAAMVRVEGAIAGAAAGAVEGTAAGVVALAIGGALAGVVARPAEDGGTGRAAVPVDGQARLGANAQATRGAGE